MILKIILIDDPAEYSKLSNIIPASYLPLNLIELFTESLSKRVRSVAVEYPYVDKDYRSTYYNFYSKRHRTYDKFCFRIHLFEEWFDSKDNLNDVRESYLGSIVLRPTEVATLGRTQLSPMAIRNFSGYICESGFKNNLMGVPLDVKCFPHIMQDTDVTVCAHAVCWMVARYYSGKYAIYPERLSFDIAESTKDFSEGRIIPSRGLTMGQISEILAAIGFYPEIFIRELYEDQSLFYDILYSYVESGIPVVAAMGKKRHAVAVIGHGLMRSVAQMIKTLDVNLVSARHFIDHLIINDDNNLPYNSMEFDVSDNDAENNSVYNLDDIDGFVVPLFEKMYLSAENVLKLYQRIFHGKLLDLPCKHEKCVVRVYMTSSRSYKRKIRESTLINRLILLAQLELPMPKFIWIVEIASPSNYDKKMTDYRWIIDATANQYEIYPFLFIHDHKKMYINDRALKRQLFRIFFDTQVQPYELYENNLRRYE